MLNFSIAPRDRFKSLKPVIKRPVEIASFSFDENRKQTLDDSSLKYYYTPPIGASLSRGFETFRKRDEDRDDHLVAILNCVTDLEDKQGEARTGDICAWRGVITKLLIAPYTEADSFELNATCFQGTIFIEGDHDFEKAKEAKQLSEPTRPGALSQDLMSFWGYKFETISLLPKPWHEVSREFIESREDHVVSNIEQYCSVVETSIGGMKVVMAGEVDGIWDEKQTPLEKEVGVHPPGPDYVELKTSATLKNHFGRDRFTRKLLKFWAQSFLLGVPKIIVGFRSTDAVGSLDHLEEFETTRIPAIVRSEAEQMQREPIWELGVCVGFLGALFQFLKEHITEGGVWKIKRREESSTVEIWKIQETGVGEIVSPEFLAWREESGRKGANW